MVVTDGPGTPGRGDGWERIVRGDLAEPTLQAQVDALFAIGEIYQERVDLSRVGIRGWSFGGYLAALAVLRRPDIFHAAVAGAPVTDWTLYDTFYTERYMDTPQDNADGYDKSSVFYHLDNWEGELPPLILIHGMADDNVTFDNTTRLMAEMQEKGLLFDLMTYPGQRHGIRGEALQKHLMRTRMQFLNRHLKPGE